MMAITSVALQAQLGTDQGSPLVIRAYEPSQGSKQHWLIQGGATYPGRTRMIDTTASDTAATQAAAVLAALVA
jgi:hypothetical protein